MTAIPLILLGSLVRLAPHPPNAAAMGALALFAGAKLPRRWAWIVPLAAMTATDLWKDWGLGLPAITLTRASIYLSLALTVGLGRSSRAATGPWSRAGMALAASSLFFLLTNLAVWASPQVASPGHPTFEATSRGLAMCYLSALPYFGNTAVADLIGVAVLFGLDAAAVRVLGGRERLVASAAR